ncbi:single-stranded-DNA-specific exonuclease RecJ [Christiangramia flava]|uniref:Single-stranded-DNA-specific exonuclease RecJ n=1 Tax=Christiangramia flava JLT2011 TaxID=1229726 RepID=A0A1L7I507_9FLAO|nr:single-stranded-DNA-specific exonuclease RecJ [Christiangramia flava]APU68195.1 Single-stranded-DNA-specific exonuclease RecJ [Christiangramia flava JLT2011]OSS41018.1 Single-stranded-DNA-specific exonuclease RecJ [Christiangramia flava JLT2011]
MRWTLKPKPDSIVSEKLSEELGVSLPVAKLLVQRGIETFQEAKDFFRPDLDKLHDPFLMKDMDLAVKRLSEAIENGENIMIYGDYDVDGTSSVSLVYSWLKFRHPNVATYIPDRYEEGYGISFQGIDFAADNDISLIVALDCGIKEIEKVAYARSKGIDFIICDHHRPGAEIPEAVAVLDPKRTDCDYPYDELCGCGVGFKLIQAYTQFHNEETDSLVTYLDLVATAIAADIVPITGENRILAYHGLHVLNVAPRNGLASLIGNRKPVTISDVVFIAAPRINAAGRMKHGQHAVNLLTEEDPEKAAELAGEIEVFNSDRRDADKIITEEARQQIIELEEENRMTTVVYNEHWHKGVIGIVASRLTETWYRPTLVFTKSGEKLAASARSVRGFDVYEALEGCKDHIEQFGGHKYAAGLTLMEDQFENFKQKFEEVVSQTIDKKLLTPEILIDAEIDLEEITPKFYRILKQFAPFGPGNMSPVFLTRGLIDTGFGKCVGEDRSHLKCQVKQRDGGPAFNVIGFNLGEKLEMIKDHKRFDAVYSIDENTWNGNTTLQLKLRDIRESVEF